MATPRVGKPSPSPIPTAILSDVSRLSEDAVPVPLGVTPAVDETNNELCELAVKAASAELVAGF